MDINPPPSSSAAPSMIGAMSLDLCRVKPGQVFGSNHSPESVVTANPSFDGAASMDVDVPGDSAVADCTLVDTKSDLSCLDPALALLAKQQELSYHKLDAMTAAQLKRLLKDVNDKRGLKRNATHCLKLSVNGKALTKPELLELLAGTFGFARDDAPPTHLVTMTPAQEIDAEISERQMDLIYLHAFFWLSSGQSTSALGHFEAENEFFAAKGEFFSTEPYVGTHLWPCSCRGCGQRKCGIASTESCHDAADLDRWCIITRFHHG